MNINPISNNSFGAKYVCSTAIKARQSNGSYKNKTVSFMQLSRTSYADRQILVKLNELWKGKYNHIKYIIYDFYSKNLQCNREVYILADSQKKFNSPSPEDILGLFLIAKNDNMNMLCYIDTRPDFAGSAPDKKYKNIGTSMVNYIKQISGDKNIYLISETDAVGFYLKQGFTMLNPDETEPTMIF